MNWWQSLLAIFLGNAFVLVPLVISGHAGAKYGIPFPAFVRSSFGTMGAHIPSLLRAFIACGWFGIQTWMGGLIAGVIGIFIFPWKLLDAYLIWLISFSGLLGAAVGVIVCDYLVLRRGVLSLDDLYSETGIYVYSSGFNRMALIAFAAGVLTALAGKLDPQLVFLFDGAWFSAAAVSFSVCWLLMKRPSNLAADTLH